MNTHQPTWDDCQQLLSTLFTTEEQDRILAASRRNVIELDGLVTTRPDVINDIFPLRRPDWDPNTYKGRGSLSIYRQTLMKGLREAARKPTNLAKVKKVIQGPDEPPGVFLERLMEAYKRYTPFNPTSETHQASVIMAFVGQAAEDIKKKLQRLKDIQEKTLQDLVKEAEKVFSKRKTKEEREERLEKERREWQEKRNKERKEAEEREREERERREERKDRRRNRELARVLAVVADRSSTGQKGRDLGPRRRRPLDKDQCARCRQRGHWARECPQPPRSPRPARTLALESE